LSNRKIDLLNFLKNPSAELTAVVMPDFFQDRLINLDCSTQDFSSAIGALVKRKGGSIDGIVQKDLRGGNAINVASALAALGAKVTPIVCTSKLGLEQIRFHLKQYKVNTSHVKICADASVTTALEFKTQNGKANVMLRELGSLADFSPTDLTESEYELMEEADYLCLFNWAGTRKYGTQLAEAVFSRAKRRSKCKIFYDTADPTPNRNKIPELIEKVLKSSCLDILSVNENEAVTYASFLDEEINEKKSNLRLDELAMESARILAKHLSARIDLHTTTFSTTLTKKQVVVVPAFKVNALRATGAGDAWDAGNIIGDGNNLPDECRLALANAVSAFYLANPKAEHPNRRSLIKFVEKAVFCS
jgi:sugar/nucleoside kinase (ribokinase family)